MKEILTFLAACIVWIYLIIGIYIIPRLYAAIDRSDHPRAILFGTIGASLFFVGCAFTHLELTLHLIGEDPALHPSHYWHHIANHVPQVFGAFTFMFVVQQYLDVTIISRERASRSNEKERMRKELESARRMEAVGQLGAGVAHDFKHIIGIVKNYLRYVVNALPHESRQAVKEDVAIIHEAIDQGEHLARRLALLGRRHEASPLALNINHVIERLCPLFKFERVELKCDLDPCLPIVWADTWEIEQILVNLAVNSRDAMLDGGELVIRTYAHSYSVCLEVSDTGNGMRPDVALRACEPFFTTKLSGDHGQVGTGLGLSTVHGIVERSGGTFEIDSELDRGTKVTITLPAIS